MLKSSDSGFQLSGAKSELGTAGLVFGNLLLSISLKSIT